ncbi:MAG: hypothetical protein ABW164_12430 [Sphingobium sp.]
MIEDMAKFTGEGAVERAPDAELLLSLIAAEIFATASPSQAEGFFAAIGRRLATMVVMDDVRDLKDMETRANMLWRAMDWGEVRMEVRDDGILLRHRGLPRGWQSDVEGHWATLLHALLTSAYHNWFAGLGSGAALQTRVLHASDQEIELHHGV